VLVALDTACREYNVPLVAARSYGLVGSLRVSVKVRRWRLCCTRYWADSTLWLVPHPQEHTVVESKPDSAPDDLRLSAPWPELEQHCVAVDLESCDEVTHKHVPYVVLLTQALRHWRAQHQGALPASSAERAAFKEQVRGMAQSHDQENVREALAAAHKAWAPVAVPADVRALLDDPAVEAAASAPSSSTPDFWLLCASLKAFVAAQGALPLEGTIPDMTATTDSYIALQRLYAARAQADVAAVEGHLAALLRAGGRPAGAIPHDAVRLFCKNAAHLSVSRYTALALDMPATDGAGQGGAAAHSAQSALLARACAAEDTCTNAMLHLLLRAADRCAAQLGRWPGTFDSAVEEDVPRLKAAVTSLLAEYGHSALSGLSVPDDLVSEMCRFGAGELHCVAAVVGGMASQEAIKLITHQFVPLPAPLIYNAMDATTTLLALA
jgi:amyloid beta precursor protein binding protein 1